MDITIIERKKGKRDMYDDLHSLQIVSADGCIRFKCQNGEEHTIEADDYDTIIIRRD